METNVSISKVKKIISKTFFCNDGDQFEQEWWPFFNERFPNCENFWRHFIVPSTNRIVQDSTDRISARDNVSDDIISITLFHYSMFMNLVYAYNHLLNFTLSSFDNFYTHLASTCDLAEEFLLKVYLLIIECQNQKSDMLQKLSKKDFLSLCNKWYDDNYPKVYENYLQKGKFTSIAVPNRKNVLVNFRTF